MSNRHQRRASVADFKRDAAGGYLDVHLVPADAPISEPLLRDAVQFWRANVAVRKPTCIGCGARFAAVEQAGAYLFARPSRAPTSCSTSALCAACWSRLSDDEVEAAALRVVRKVMPGAAFDPR
jgi:hypothetical protein